MNAVKKPIQVVLPDTELAKFHESTTLYLPAKKHSAELAMEKFKKSGYYKKLLKVSSIFDLQVEDLTVLDHDAYSKDEVWYSVGFCLKGETNVLRDMLTSLFAKFFLAVEEAEEDGDKIELQAA